MNIIACLMTCQLTVMSLNLPNSDNGVLQLAYCLDVAPQLETLQLDVSAILSVYINKYMDLKYTTTA